jgi:predicted transcriptional regulator
MNAIPYGSLSRRERQVMEFLYRKPGASVSEIRGGISKPPGYSAVRATVGILERKGNLRHVQQGKKYLYSPVVSRGQAVQGAVRHLLETYFEGSLEEAVAAMVQLHGKELRTAEIGRLEQAIRRLRRKERQR